MFKKGLIGLVLLAGFALAGAQDAVSFSDLQPYTMVHSIRDREHSRELLVQPLVQKDLQLTEGAILRINALYETAERAIRTTSLCAHDYEVQGKDKEFRAEVSKAQELYRKFEDDSYSLLTGPQRDRLYELSIQKLGTELLDQPLTVQKLGLSEAQRTLVHKLCFEAYGRRMKADDANPMTPGSTQEEMALVVARSAEITEQLQVELAAIPALVLTPAQLRVWRSLAGEPLRTAELSPAAFPPPPRV